MNTGKTRESYIIRFFRFLTQFFYQALGAGIIGRFFSSYQSSDRLFRRSRIGRLIDHIERGGGRIYCTIRRGIALAIDKSLIRRGLKRLWHLLCAASLRTVGVFFLTAGAYSVITYALFFFIWKTEIVGVIHLYAGIAAALLGFFLLFFDTSVAHALRTGLIFGKLLLPALGFSEEAFKDIPRVGTSGYYLAVPLGMLIGLLSALTSPLYILAALLVLALFFIVISSPEAGMLLLMLFLPFAGFLENGTLWLAFAAGLPLASYLIKILRGNRVFTLNIEDFVVMLLVLATVLSGVSVAGASAWSGALIAALMIALYFLVVNTVANPSWLERSRFALIFSATAAALVGIAQFARAAFLAKGSVAIGALGEAVKAGFVDRTTFAYFLVVAFPFALCAFIDGKRLYRLFAGFACLAIAATAVLTWVQSAWAALLVILIVFALIRVKQIFPFILLFALFCPLILWILPDGARQAFLSVVRANSGTSFARTETAKQLASRVFSEGDSHLFGGFGGIFRIFFGLGHGGFEHFCMLYTAISPAEAAETLNFWQYTLLEGGIVGVLLPGLFFFFILQNCFSLLRVGANAAQPIWPVAGVTVIVGTLVMGIFRYAWYDFSALAAFFIAAALIAANARCERRQNEIQGPEREADSTFAQIDYYRAH